MYTSLFKDCTLSGLGFGTMRLPVLPDGTIDQLALDRMVDYALSHGVNYFDTAWFYHDHTSEAAIGKSLSRYPRNAYHLATKLPLHHLKKPEDIPYIFEEQLKRCQVDYFDFYLLHAVTETSADIVSSPEFQTMEYLLEQKKNGRIRHLGYSTHAKLPLFTEFLEQYHNELEFCQIQLNYLDWTLQQAKEKCRLLNAYQMPIWVMEPVRGGLLADLPDQAVEAMKQLHPDWSIPSWAFRWLMGIDGVQMVLSGMSNMEQMADNVETFTSGKPLNEEEAELLSVVAKKLETSIPCTGCRYCMNECPQGLFIPDLIRTLNALRYESSDALLARLRTLPEEGKPTACVGCGSCAKVCPQGLDVPALLKELAEKL